MKIELSIHAQIRSRERRISADIIKRVISSPTKISNKFGDRIEVQKDIDGRTITVIYIKDKSKFIVITVI